MIQGHATQPGTRRFAERFPGAMRAGHFRIAESLSWSSIGIGTYLGLQDEQADSGYIDALRTCFANAVNVVDTAINYRGQRSERNIGHAIRASVEAGSVSRDELIICTKGGFLPAPASQFIRSGIIDDPARDLVEDMHCMTPRFLRDQLQRSLANLGLSCVDVYFVHNPETQLPAVGHDDFYVRLARAFDALESEAAAGRIQFYGVATWTGFREDPASPMLLDLARIVETATEVAGPHHRFRFVQLPVNLTMPEAIALHNQRGKHNQIPLAAAARELGVHVLASASILQGRLARGLPARIRNAIDGVDSDAQAALQYTRALPITTALVGMSNASHVQENLALVEVPPTLRA